VIADRPFFPLAQRGFTLIEILVVMVIIGIILALSVVHFGESDATRVSREAERLSLLLEAARDEAISSGNTLGWSADARGYRFWKREESQWLLLEDNDTLRARELPEGMRVAEVRVNLAPLPDGSKLSFSPSGVNAPFTLVLSMGAANRHLAGDAMGRINEVTEASRAAPAQ